MMWSSVSPESLEEDSPSARSKHSATLWQGYVYLLGGRNGNLPLKDFWKYCLADGKWTKLKPTGDLPPCLQEHTAVIYKNNIYVFGGEISFSSASETPLWCYDILKNTWRKIRHQKGVKVPIGRRSHTALVYRGSMLIYGGYMDLKGSTSELWAFHFETESWHLLSSSNKENSNFPPPRHKHSAVLYDESMWIFGGMTDLQERADLWRFDLRLKQWICCRVKPAPGPLHSHAACRLPSAMLIFGGERAGISTNDLWKFNFDTENWEKISLDGLKPHARSECVAFAVSEFLLKENTVELRSRTRCRTAMEKSRMGSNRVTPVEQTYVFQPSNKNYIDNTEEKSEDKSSFLKEISKLSQINLSRLSQNRCSYSVLTTKNDSQESLLNKNSSNEIVETTPTRMIKSKSAYAFKKKEFGESAHKNHENTLGDSNCITREPISVPNFSTLVLPTPVLTPVEATKLVYLDSDEERDYQREIQQEKNCRKSKNYDHFSVKRDESYISHLGYQDNPLYQNLEINMKFTKVDETFDENSTSDYCSIETVSHVSSKTAKITKKDKNGPFGFSNPNYLGPDISNHNNQKNYSTHLSENDKKNFQKILNTPDSVLEESFGKTSQFLEENVELQNMANNEKILPTHNQSKNTNFTKIPPKTLDLDTSVIKNRTIFCKNRASSASRVEKVTKNIEKVTRNQNPLDLEKTSSNTFIPLYIFIIGGKERGQITVFKRPISIWKLKLF